MGGGDRRLVSRVCSLELLSAGLPEQRVQWQGGDPCLEDTRSDLIDFLGDQSLRRVTNVYTIVSCSKMSLKISKCEKQYSSVDH